MKKYRRWVGLITIILCAFIMNSSSVEVQAAKCTKDKAKDYYSLNAKVDDANKQIVITAKKGKYTVTFEHGLTGSYTLEAGTPLNIAYDPSTIKGVISGKATLIEGTSECEVEANQLEYNMSFDIGSANETVENTFYNDAETCAKFRNEAAAKGSEAVAFMQKTLNYCYQPQVSANFSKKNLTTMIKNANAAWNAKQLAINAVKNDLTISEGFTQVSNTNLSNTLKCDPWTKENNVKKYAFSKTVISNDVCRTDCKEELTVIYGPPVSVKAGLCFTYTVEVKSKATCSTTVTGDPPSMPPVCNPYPICNNLGENWNDQAGPTEEFDQCVQKCDGGKYSQSCINKCNKKVYGASGSRKMLSYNPSLRASKMASGARCNQNASADSIYEDIQANGDGYYYWSGDTIKWHAGSCYWDGLGRYYFNSREKAARTVANTSPNCREYYPGDMSGASCYVISDGFKRASNCSESCTWTGCSSGDALNPKEAADEYNEQLRDYENKIRECSSYAKCDEKTTYFTMSVLPSNGEDWVEYSATNHPAQGNTTAPSGDTIINDQSGDCYGKQDAEGNDYRTVMNFPGVWKSNKDGSIITERPPKDQEIFYKSKPNQYCTPLNSSNVNEKWWAWDQGVKEYDDAEKSSVESSLKYNIKATVKNFGLFSWNMNINCFYAIYNGQVDESGNVDSACDLGSDKCITTDITNYRYKAASLDDLFAGSKETNNNQETGRETGWNWSCDATDLTDESYPVAPTSLITDIQTQGDSIYKDDSKYLDYSITLTPATINKIKATNKTQKNFLNYTGNKKSKTSQDEKRSVYRSSLLDDLGGSVVTTRYPSAIGCNNQEGGTCITANMIPADQCLTTYKSLMKR